MCSVKTPKPAAVEEKELVPLRNPYLDGIDPIVRARQTGTSALRIDRGVPRKPSNNLKGSSTSSGQITYSATKTSTAASPGPLDEQALKRHMITRNSAMGI